MNIKATAASLLVVFCTALLVPRISMPAGNGTYEIAKQGFVYGLPIVMNYGAMYASAVDRRGRRNAFVARYDRKRNGGSHGGETVREASDMNPQYLPK